VQVAGRQGRSPRRDGNEEAVGGVEGEGGDIVERGEGQQRRRCGGGEHGRGGAGRHGERGERG
jgi:hypothetical protein